MKRSIYFLSFLLFLVMGPKVSFALEEEERAIMGEEELNREIKRLVQKTWYDDYEEARRLHRNARIGERKTNTCAWIFGGVSSILGIIAGGFSTFIEDEETQRIASGSFALGALVCGGIAACVAIRETTHQKRQKELEAPEELIARYRDIIYKSGAKEMFESRGVSEGAFDASLSYILAESPPPDPA